MRRWRSAAWRARIAALVGATGAAMNAAAAAGDPLESAECRRAIATLDGEETAFAAAARASGTDPGRRGDAAKLDAARREAATACLASRTDPPRQALPLARPPPVAVAPLAVAPASAPATRAATARAAPQPPLGRAAERPYAITSCDAGGCWANDGSRLNRIGTTLWGPRGMCTVQGSLVQCP